MERFELPTDGPVDRGDHAPGGWTPAGGPAPDDAGDPQEHSDWDPDAVVWRATASYEGLLAIGALVGSAAAVVVSLVADWSGVTASIAVVVGLDVGVLVGAGTGGLLSRLHRRRGAAAHRAHEAG